MKKNELFSKIFAKKFGGNEKMSTFAVPKLKQPLALGEKERNVAIKLNLIEKWILLK